MISKDEGSQWNLNVADLFTPRRNRAHNERSNVIKKPSAESAGKSAGEIFVHFFHFVYEHRNSPEESPAVGPL